MNRQQQIINAALSFAQERLDEFNESLIPLWCESNDGIEWDSCQTRLINLGDDIVGEIDNDEINDIIDGKETKNPKGEEWAVYGPDPDNHLSPFRSKRTIYLDSVHLDSGTSAAVARQEILGGYGFDPNITIALRKMK